MKRQGRALALGGAFFVLLVSIGLGVSSKKNSALLCREPREVSIAFGTEKVPLLNDPKFRELHEQGCWKIVPSSMGSIQMVANYSPNQAKPSYDVLWPAGETSVDDLAKKIGSVPSVELRAHTPLVALAGNNMFEALKRAGAVKVSSNGKASMSTKWIIDRFREGRGWSELGVGFDNWPMRFTTTNPALSNSGRNMAALVGTTMAGVQAPRMQDLQRIEPELQRYYQGGELKASTGDLFNQFLQSHGQSHPLIIAYEFEVVEAFQILGARAFEGIRVIYLDNTLVNSNPLLGVEDGDPTTDDARDYLDWLRREDVAKAFAGILEEHGFRVSRAGSAVGTARSHQEAELRAVGVFLSERISYAQEPQRVVVDRLVDMILKGRCEVLGPNGNLSLDTNCEF